MNQRATFHADTPLQALLLEQALLLAQQLEQTANAAPDSNGFNHWLNNMANGESAFGVATEIATGPEREAMVIRKDYTQFLGRIARNDEVDSWLAVFQQGSNRANVATGIVASDEFFADANKDPSTFITHAYQDVLSRTPNSNEVAFWLNVYNNP